MVKHVPAHRLCPSPPPPLSHPVRPASQVCCGFLLLSINLKQTLLPRIPCSPGGQDRHGDTVSGTVVVATVAVASTFGPVVGAAVATGISSVSRLTLIPTPENRDSGKATNDWSP